MVKKGIIFLFASLFSFLFTTCNPAGEWVMESGRVIYQRGGITITERYIDQSAFSDAVILLSVDNDRGGDVVIKCRSLWVNGHRLDPKFGREVQNRKRQYENIRIPADSLEERAVSHIKKLALVFAVVDAHTGTLLYETDKLVLFDCSQ